MKKYLLALALSMVSSMAFAVDVFDGRFLSIPRVKVGESFYFDVKITVNQVLAVEGGAPKDKHDVYIDSNNQLRIPSVFAYGKLYTNVLITVGDVVAVGTGCIISNCPYFVQSTRELEDPSSYYTCTDFLFLNMVDTIDMNQDGVKDIVLHYWCNQWNKPPTYNEQTPNAIVVYLSQPDGTYKISNQSLFGQRIVELTGASRNSRVADFNQDGYPDIAYAMNHEDGRPLSDERGWNQAAQTSFLMSSPNGQYKVEKFGPSDWYHGLSLAKNSEGSFDVVLQGFGVTPKAFRFSNNQWSTVSGYPQLSGLGYAFVEPQFGASSLVVTSGLNSPAQLQSFGKTNGQWTELSSISYPSKSIPYLTWQGTNMDATTITVGSDDLVAAGFVDMCTTTLTPKGNPFVLATLNGNQLKGGYKDSMGRIKEGSLPLYQSFQAYELVNGRLTLRPATMVGEDTGISFNKFDCKDVNGDGLVDLVGYPVNDTNGQPVLFLNNGQGQLVRVNQKIFPTAPNCYFGSGSRMADLDGDGIADLIIFRTGPSGTYCNLPPLTIFYGVKPIE